MFKIDQLTAANQAAIDQFSYFARLSLANIEKFAEMGLEAARDSVVRGASHAQSLSSARDVHEVIAINSAALEPALKRAYAYSRSAFEQAAQTNDTVKRALEKQTAELSRTSLAALEEAFKYAPAGSESVVGNVKSALAAAQSAYDNLAAINMQIYDTLERTAEQSVASVQSVSSPKRASAKRAK